MEFTTCLKFNKGATIAKIISFVNTQNSNFHSRDFLQAGYPQGSKVNLVLFTDKCLTRTNERVLVAGKSIALSSKQLAMNHSLKSPRSWIEGFI